MYHVEASAKYRPAFTDL